MFEANVSNWMQKYGFGQIKISCASDFAYNIEEKKIMIGTTAYPQISRYFEQFLYEFGMEYCGIYDAVLAFLHELGHACTINMFSGEEQLFCHLTKQFCTIEDEHEWFDFYWMVPDEFLANLWVIDFINSNIAAVEELCNNWRD